MVPSVASRVLLQQRMSALAQFGQQLRLEPGIALEPGGVAPARMRQGQEAWQILAPAHYRFMQTRPAIGTEVIGLGIRADQQRKTDLPEMRPAARMPRPRARTGT